MHTCQAAGRKLIAELGRIVGRNHLLTEPAKTERYRKGFRSGEGDALAWCFPPVYWSSGASCKPVLPPM